MSDVVGSFTALASSVVDEVKEHSTGLLFAANCALWFFAGFLAEKVI